MAADELDDGLERGYSAEEGGEALLVFLALALRRGGGGLPDSGVVRIEDGTVTFIPDEVATDLAD